LETPFRLIIEGPVRGRTAASGAIVAVRADASLMSVKGMLHFDCDDSLSGV
jgi:hypothetical protein